MHVSKPPKENSTGGLFYKKLKAVSESLNMTTVEGVHKKINLADETLAWEHERYSIRRFPATTLSTLKSHEDPIRTTILDVIETRQIDRLYKHTQTVAEALARHIYNLSSSQVFMDPLVYIFYHLCKRNEKIHLFVLLTELNFFREFLRNHYPYGLVT